MAAEKPSRMTVPSPADFATGPEFLAELRKVADLCGGTPGGLDGSPLAPYIELPTGETRGRAHPGDELVKAKGGFRIVRP